MGSGASVHWMSRLRSVVGAARRWVSWLWRWSRLAWRKGVNAWRRRLALRIVTITLVVSALVSAVLGVLLMNQISHGLVETKRTQAIDELKSGQRYAEQQLAPLGGASDPATDATLRTVVVNLSTRGGQTAGFAVAIRTKNVQLPRLYVAQYEPDKVTIPAKLVALVSTRHTPGYQYVRTSLDQRKPRPFLVVGAPVQISGGDFQLYYFFPLDSETETIGLVRQALLGTGVLLVVLLAGIAWVVTRQVVTPVRMAVRAAERLSAGLLAERMEVKGADDFARLAQSFNQMAANLQSQIVQLEEFSRLQRRFTSDVSHELRTPLTTVRMAADVLFHAREDLAPDAARSAELLSAELDRFEALLSDLLEISRYDGGFAVLDAEPTELAGLVRRVVAGLAPLGLRNHVELRMILPSAPVIAEVDARRIERVLRNLVGNALEYAEGRPVVVRLVADAGRAAFAVRDYGVGLREDDTDAVFNRFWRADPSRARQTGGTGLGLSIALEDARLHGGMLRAWGRPGAGTQFVLTVPLHTGGLVEEELLPVEPDDGGVPPPASDPNPPISSGSH